MFGPQNSVLFRWGLDLMAHMQIKQPFRGASGVLMEVGAGRTPQRSLERGTCWNMPFPLLTVVFKALHSLPPHPQCHSSSPFPFSISVSTSSFLPELCVLCAACSGSSASGLSHGVAFVSHGSWQRGPRSLGCPSLTPALEWHHPCMLSQGTLLKIVLHALTPLA